MPRNPRIGTADATGDFRLLLASRYPLIIAETREEARFLALVEDVIADLDLPLWTWSATRGLARDGMGADPGSTDARKALEGLSRVTAPGVFVFLDLHHGLRDPVIIRLVKEFAQHAEEDQTLVVTVPERVDPPDLRGLALPWLLRPPAEEELKDLVQRSLSDLEDRGIPVSLSEDASQELVRALRGLSLTEAERLIQRAAVRDGEMHPEDVPYVRSIKANLLEENTILELIEVNLGDLDDVGGLDRLKEWLHLRGRAMEPEAAAFGLEPPRGVLITGVPGCGKSLIAKTLAQTWGLPLILLDPARIFGPLLGESEQRLRDALKTVEAMAPIVLWVDEIEKGFASGGRADSGASQRILGTILRWMQERPAGVFFVATCNDVTSLPPEFLRKGRFDEIFFVDLPEAAERAQIFRLHLERRRWDPDDFDLEELVQATDGFSGAEIEAAIVGALYRSYAADTDLTTDQLLEEIAATVPLSRARPEEIGALRTWAESRAVPAQDKSAAGPRKRTGGGKSTPATRKRAAGGKSRSRSR